MLWAAILSISWILNVTEPLVGLIGHGFTHAADAESCSWIPDAVRVEVNGLLNASRQKYPGSGSSKPTARCNDDPSQQHFFWCRIVFNLKKQSSRFHGKTSKDLFPTQNLIKCWEVLSFLFFISLEDCWLFGLCDHQYLLIASCFNGGVSYSTLHIYRITGCQRSTSLHIIKSRHYFHNYSVRKALKAAQKLLQNLPACVQAPTRRMHAQIHQPGQFGAFYLLLTLRWKCFIAAFRLSTGAA